MERNALVCEAAVRRVDLEESVTTSRRTEQAKLPTRRARQRSRCLPGLLFASFLMASARAAGPTLQAMEDVVIKACADSTVQALQCPAASSCQDGEAQLVLGHSDPDLIGSLIVSVQTITPALATLDSPLRDVVVRSISGQKVITVCPKGKAYGRSTVNLKVADEAGNSILTEFGVVVQPLAPVFDDAGPTR